MLVASKSGLISLVDLIAESQDSWVVIDEKVEKTISKTDKHTRAFDLMSDALKWSGAESKLIQSFLDREAKAAQEALTH